MGVNHLYKNTFNTFKKKKFQLFAISLIVALSSFLYTTMSYSIDGLKGPLESFIESTNQEDFSIEMVNAITEDDLNALSDEDQTKLMPYLTYQLTAIKQFDEPLYNEIIANRLSGIKTINESLLLELREYKPVNFNQKGVSHKVTLYKDADQINTSFIEEGAEPVNDDEIAVTRIYAKKNNLTIGDSLTIQGRELEITGFVLFSDYTLPLQMEDFIIDNSKLTVGLVTDAVYEAFKGDEQFYVSGELLNDYTGKAFTKDYNAEDELDFVTSMTLTENQMRSGGIYTELQGGQAMTIGISVMISAIAVLIVLIITSKIVQAQKAQIGVLKALGYSNSEILKPYVLLLTIISLPMLLVGYGLGVFASGPLKSLYLEFYLIPDGTVQTNLMVLLIAIVLPLLTILSLSMILINKMLSKKALDLIKVSDGKKVSTLNKLSKRLLKRARPQTKYKYSVIFSNQSKFIAFILGIMFSSMLIIMSLMMMNFFDKMTVDYYESVDYVYEGYVDLSKELPELTDEEEAFITLPNAMYENDAVNLVGLETDNSLHKIYDVKEDEITTLLKDGVIINRGFELTYDVKIDDKIELTIDGDKHTFEVVGISDDYQGTKMYVNREALSEIIMDGNTFVNMDDDAFYNGVYSTVKLDEDNFLSVTNKLDILEQTEMMQGFITIAIGYMIFSAICIAVIVLYVLTTMTVEDNFYSISLLKVMGYSKQEINKMALNSYLVCAVLTYLVSIPMTVMSFGFMVKFLAQEFGMVMPFDFEAWHGIVGFVIIIVIYLLGSLAAKRKINRVSLQEVLKAYRD